MTDPAALTFAILGPLSGTLGGSTLDLGPPQQRTILALLLIRAGQRVGVDEMIDALWESDAPASATNLIHRYIGTLRRLLEPGLPARDHGRFLSRDQQGYRLVIDRRAVDLLRFRDAVASARAAARADDRRTGVQLYVQALGLWQGRCATNVALTPSAVPAFATVDQERSSAAIDLANLCADVESARAALPGVEAAAHVDPLNEPLQSGLLRLLGMSGRQADAITVYQSTRKRLAEELGVDAGADLQETYLALLRQQNSGDEPAPTDHEPLVRPAQLPADLSTFGGRSAEIAQLSEALVDLPPRSVAIVGIDGMPGTGKTTLAVHWARQVADDYPDGQLFANLRGFDADARPVKPTEVLRDFLDALGVAPQRIPENLSAQAGLFRSLLAGKKVLILLDNARDTEHVRHLLPGSPGCLAIVTSRHSLSGLVAEHGAHLLTLDPLSQADAERALLRRLGHRRVTEDPEAVTRIIEACSRLPLALAVVTARAVAHPQFPLSLIAAELRQTRGRLDALSGGGSGIDVRAVFSWSYAMLAPGTARLFRLLTVHPGYELSVPVAASLAGEDTQAVHRQLDDLARNHLITETHPGIYRMHDLIREYAAEVCAAHDSDWERRQALIRALEHHHLHSAHAAQVMLHPHQMPTALRPAAGVTVPGPTDYRQATAWFVAQHRLLAEVVRLAVEQDEVEYAWRIALTLQQFYQRSGHLADWASTVSIALDAAVRAGDVVGEAHSRRSLAGAYHFLGRDDDARAELDRTLQLYEQLGYTTEQAYAFSNLGVVTGVQGRHAESVGHHRRALELYRAAGHRGGEANATAAIGWSENQRGNHELAIGYGRQAMAIYAELDDPLGVADCWGNLGDAYLKLRRYDDAAEAYERAAALALDMTDPRIRHDSS
ncbi:BTAD domain-containing putative transcriptional regulator [Phytohabitans flavus]|uniref:AfsR/SARP family transcriptional regulator n=1 Tax=Phytohabitans flavus TaxID=1076124 RepID=UPI00362D215F